MVDSYVPTLEFFRAMARSIRAAGRAAIVVKVNEQGALDFESEIPPDGDMHKLVLGAWWAYCPPQPGDIADDPMCDLIYYTLVGPRGQRGRLFQRQLSADMDHRIVFANPWFRSFVSKHGALKWNPPDIECAGTDEWFSTLGRDPTDSEIEVAKGLYQLKSGFNQAPRHRHSKHRKKTKRKR